MTTTNLTMSPAKRTDRAGRIMDIYAQRVEAANHDERFTELLTDLLHCADCYGVDFQAALGMANLTYSAEIQNEAP